VHSFQLTETLKNMVTHGTIAGNLSQMTVAEERFMDREGGAKNIKYKFCFAPKLRNICINHCSMGAWFCTFFMLLNIHWGLGAICLVILGIYYQN